MRCFIEIFNETKETANTFGGALSDLVSLLVLMLKRDINQALQTNSLFIAGKMCKYCCFKSLGWSIQCKMGFSSFPIL
jgi:hypothetical protein